jgi:hypothetical protein
MKKLLLLLALAPGCGLLTDETKDRLKDPETIQILDQVARDAAKKAALETAALGQVTDQSAINQMVEQAKTAASIAVNAAVQRFEAQDKVSRKMWREETKAQIGASLQGIGGAVGAAGATTGQPLLIGIGALLAAAGGLFANKKRIEKKEAKTSGHLAHQP